MVSLALLSLLAVLVDFGEFRAALSQVAVGPFVLSLGLAGAAYPLHAWRLQFLLVAHGIAPGFAWLHAVTWIGQFYNALLPTGVGGDAARLYHLHRFDPGRRAGAVASLLLDRLTGLISLAGLTTLALAGYLMRGTASPLVAPWLGPVLLGLIALSGGFLLAAFLPVSRWPRRLRAGMMRGLSSRRYVILRRTTRRATALNADLARVFVISVLIWLAEFLSAYVLARSCGLEVGMLEVSIAVAVANLATVLPLGIGGHGIREGALLAALAALHTPIGLTPAGQAVVFALLFFGVTAWWSLVGGVVQGAAALGWCPPRAPTPQSAN